MKDEANVSKHGGFSTDADADILDASETDTQNISEGSSSGTTSTIASRNTSRTIVLLSQAALEDLEARRRDVTEPEKNG